MFLFVNTKASLFSDRVKQQFDGRRNVFFGKTGLTFYILRLKASCLRYENIGKVWHLFATFGNSVVNYSIKRANFYPLPPHLKRSTAGQMREISHRWLLFSILRKPKWRKSDENRESWSGHHAR